MLTLSVSTVRYANLSGKRLAVVAIGLDDKGETEGAVWTGAARWFDGHLYLDRAEGETPFELLDDVPGRIRQAPDGLSDLLLGAEYYVRMSIGPLPDDANPADYRSTGLKWPT